MIETDTSRERLELAISDAKPSGLTWVHVDDLRALLTRADTAWNDAIEAAAHECEQVAYSGKYPQVDQIELGCLRCRDSIRALRKGVTP